MRIMLFRLLDYSYKKIWVPSFGRILFYFSSMIEDKKITTPPTYEIDDKKLQLLKPGSGGNEWTDS